MALSRDDVKHIAKLARLELREDELSKFSLQLSAILEAAESLKEVNTDGATAIAQVTELENVHFEDEVSACEVADELLKQSPQPVQDRMIRMPNVFE